MTRAEEQAIQDIVLTPDKSAILPIFVDEDGYKIERTCLYWMCRGKTFLEIEQYLALGSPHWANFPDLRNYYSANRPAPTKIELLRHFSSRVLEWDNLDSSTLQRINEYYGSRGALALKLCQLADKLREEKEAEGRANAAQ